MIYAFDSYSVDAERRELRRGGHLVSLEPQIFDLLQYLIRNRERVVSRDDLISAVWNGRVVSESTLSSRISVLRGVIGDDGKDQRLVKTLPRKGFRFVGQVSERQPQPSLEGLALPDKPSIAVLPFLNLSDDVQQEYFADGIVEEITTALSRFSSIFVIARNSSFSYKGRSINVKQVGRELGVGYVLEGSVRKAENRVRITAQLIQVETGAHIWAEHYEGDLDRVFDLQDEVASSVAAAVVPSLQGYEIDQARRKRQDNLGAYDLYLRALPHVHAMTRSDSDDAVRLLKKAFQLDTQFGVAASTLSTVLLFRVAFGWADRRDAQADALTYARMALSVDRNDPEALARFAGAISFFLGQHRDGIDHVTRAVAINPNSSMAWRASAYLHSWAGDAETAVHHFDRALRLSPRDPLDFHLLAGKAVAFISLHQDNEAEAAARLAVQRGPLHAAAWRCWAAALALVGKRDEARVALAESRRLAPDISLQRIASDNAMIHLPPRLFTGLREAGLPE